MRISLTVMTDQGPRDVVVNGDSDMTVETVARSLIATLNTVRNSPTGNDALAEVVPLPGARWIDETPHPLWAGGRTLDPAAPAARVLRDGAVVAVDPAGAAATVLTEPSGIVEVRVSGGPASGAVHRLGIGETTIGAAADAGVRLGDPSVPPHALTVTVESRRVTVRGHGVLDGAALAGTAEWPAGGVLVVGSTVLTLAPSTTPDAHLSPLADGGLVCTRPPRTLPPASRRVLEVPRRPRKHQRDRLRLLGPLLFAAAGVALAVATGQWYWALMALAYPVIQVREWAGDRRYGRRSYRRAMREYRRRSAAFERDLDRLRRADEAERRSRAPDPPEVLLTATGPRRRLWERRAEDPDALHLRFGLADRPARVELAPARGDGDEPVMAGPPVARDVPVTLPLPELGVIGLSGPRARSRALARWLVAQAAVLHSPRDLAIVVLTTDPDGAEHWNWVRWLPHCAPREGEECVALVGTDPESVARRITELAIRITERRRAADHRPAGLAGQGAAAPGTPARPYTILLVLDGARQLRRVPGMPQVLSGGPAFGIHAICVDDDERLLPEECAAVAVWDWDRPTHVRLRGHGLDTVGPVLADQVSAAWCDRMARALAPVRDVSRDDPEAAIPRDVRLLEILGMPAPSAAFVQAVWATGGRTTSVPVGVCADGVFSLDLRADGPHGLIAGASGAGGSELLQTLIASLAVANRPDEMAFVLIDDKGGAAFADCAALPHVTGMVTGLDGHLAARALDSLGAELRRREAVLRHAGAKDLDEYQRLFDAGDPRASVRLPRLVIVTDEFAVLAGELPGFVAGLVDIGRRGRSLGVHLLLATRRPAGVTAGIRDSTGLRIALRVTEPEESADIIGDPAAAGIARSTPGRGYVRSKAAVPRAVQFARVGGRRAGMTAMPVHVAVMPWTHLGRLPAHTERTAEPPAGTDLRALVAAVREAAERTGIDRPAPPWLPPLPDAVTLDELPAVFADGDDVPPLAYGLTDLPAAQSRAALTLDLVGGGHMYVTGSPLSGRSTVLRTLAGALASSCAPADVHLYAIDCGAGALLPLAALPHCGAVVGRDRTERVERLLGRLHVEVARRRQVLAATGFASPAEQRAAVTPAERLPWILLMLDRWEGFVAAFENHDHGRLVDSVLRLLHEGAAVGLRAVFTGDHSGLGGQVATVFDTRLILRLADPAEYACAGIGERHVPSPMPPGRAIEAGPPGAPVRESQIALLNRDATGTAQAAALRRLAREAGTAYERPPRGLRPLRVDELPVRVTYAEALALDPAFKAPSPLWALVGVGGDELGPLGADLRAEGPGFTVAGPPRSGRSTALLTMVGSLLAADVGAGPVPVVLVCPRRSLLRGLEGRPGVLALLGADAHKTALEGAIGERERYVVVVDDAELLEETPLGDALTGVLRGARDLEAGVVVAGTTQDLARVQHGFVPEAGRSRSGLLLDARSPDDGDLLGVRLPRDGGPGGPVGRGLLVTVGHAVPVQTALLGEVAARRR